MRLAILGPPGSGKTTQAKRLAELCELTHIYAGELLREEAESDSPFAERIRNKLGSGRLVRSDILLTLIEREIAHANGGYILDGFPRTLEQAIELDMLLAARQERLDHAIHIDISEEEVFRRLLDRGRSDDSREVIADRIAVYHSETRPVRVFFERKGILLSISGEATPSAVTEQIIKALEASA